MVLFDRLRHLDRVQERLRDAARAGRLAHAYYFWGPEGGGKTRTAQALAQLILCASPDPPCGECVECKRVERFTHPDFHMVMPGLKATEGEERAQLEAYAADPLALLPTPRQATIAIDRIRDLKMESSKARVVAEGNRVIVLRNAERMTIEAAEAALKLIEEPQPGTFLILTGREPQRLLPTILSRCQRIRFPVLPRAFIEQALAEKGVAGDEARLIAGLSGGGLGRALQLAGEDIVELRDRALDLLAAPLSRATEAARRAERAGAGWDCDAALAAAEMVLSWYGDLIAMQAGAGGEGIIHADRLPELSAAAKGADLGDIRRRVAAIEEMLEALEQNVNPQLALRAALLRMNGLVEDDPLF